MGIITMVEWRCPSTTRSGENRSLRILRRLPHHMSLREKGVFGEKGVFKESKGYFERERGI
jgi:hypothetical protein